MKWQGREKSRNIDDRRAGGGARKVGAGIGIGGLIVVVLGLLMGGDPQQLLQQLQNSGGAIGEQAPSTEGVQQTGREDDPLAEFVAVVLKDTEDAWVKIFKEEFNEAYQQPTLVLFSEQDQSACGFASAATGPFYCPADNQIYIDLSFANELKDRFKAPGEFALAYVVAHEVGHHVQNIMGISGKVHQQKQRLSKEEANELSVRLELQADFFAGLWAHYTQDMKGVIDAADIDAAMKAASAIGDDRLQMEAQGYTVPDAFTHGTSEQRTRWFRKGWDTGDIKQGDTFAARKL
jgi:predicted metalloprotease